MLSLIVVGRQVEDIDQYLNKLFKSYGIDSFDVILINKAKTLKNSNETIGIEEARTLQSKLYLKPLKGKSKAVVVKVTQGITPEAQNALLKSLEEPPQNTIIIITIPTIRLLLPTILSRCKIIYLDFKQVYSNETLKQQQQQFNNLLQFSIGKRLKFAQDLIKDKDNTLNWIELSIAALRQELTIQNKHKISLEQINTSLRELLKTYTIISTTNANLRLVLENLLLSLPKTDK